MKKPKIYCNLLDKDHPSTEMEYIDCRGNVWQVTCPKCEKTVFIFL